MPSACGEPGRDLVGSCVLSDRRLRARPGCAGHIPATAARGTLRQIGPRLWLPRPRAFARSLFGSEWGPARNRRGPGRGLAQDSVRSTLFVVFRVLVILMLATAGLSGFAPAGVDRHGDCGHEACAPEASPSCCDSAPDSDGYCALSDGACRCGVAPVPIPLPLPDAPLPKTERDASTAIRGPPAGTVLLAPSRDDAPRPSTEPASLLSGLTHNEIQAFLGIWRI